MEIGRHALCNSQRAGIKCNVTPEIGGLKAETAELAGHLVGGMITNNNERPGTIPVIHRNGFEFLRPDLHAFIHATLTDRCTGYYLSGLSSP
jgi:hypothetical protein